MMTDMSAFSDSDLLSITLAVSAAAETSYRDDRLRTASQQYRLAAKLWGALGSPLNASKHTYRARVAEEELRDALGETA